MPGQTVDDIRHILEHLKRARLDAVKLFDDVKVEHEKAATDCKSVGEAVDVAATVLLIFNSLRKLVQESYKAIDLRGADLERHNRKILKDYAKDKVEFFTETVAQEVWKEQEKAKKGGKASGGVFVMGLEAYKLYMDLKTPSFLAAAYTDMRADGGFKARWNPDKWRNYADSVKDQTNARISSTKETALRQIDEKIAKYQRLLAAAEAKQRAAQGAQVSSPPPL